MEENVIAQNIKSQLIACLEMLKDCIDRCPENEWNQRHNDYPFSQVLFHALFDCDLNMSKNEKDLKSQKLHEENRMEFGDYEELEGKIAAKVYTRDFIGKYYIHCFNKIASTLSLLPNNELLETNSDYYKSMTKMERYINTIRHTQHHAAQLGLRLQLITGKEMEWVGREEQ